MSTKTSREIIKSSLVTAYGKILHALEDLGFDIHSDNFVGTPERCARAFLNDFVMERKALQAQSRVLIRKKFHNPDMDEMIVEKNIEVISLCPHHLIPVKMLVTIGYIPNGTVLGLSKLARLAVCFGKQPILQEAYTGDLGIFIYDNLKPLGCGIYVTGNHGCIRYRGAKQENINVITTRLFGGFKNNPSTKSEFLKYCL